MLYLGYVLLWYVLIYNLKVPSNFHLTFLQLNVIKMFNVQEKLFFYLTLGYFLRAPDNSTVISWGAVFIIQTSDRMQYFTILQDKLNSFNIQDDRSKRGLFARPFKKCPKSPLQLAGSRTGQICSASRCAWMNINRVTLRIYYRIIEFIMFIFYVMVHNEV